MLVSWVAGHPEIGDPDNLKALHPQKWVIRTGGEMNSSCMMSSSLSAHVCVIMYRNVRPCMMMMCYSPAKHVWIRPELNIIMLQSIHKHTERLYVFYGGA